MKFPLELLVRGAQKRNPGLAVTQTAIDSYYTHTEQDNQGGFYPIGVNTTWHGGIHLHAPLRTPIHSMAEGRVVAARLGEKATAKKHYGSSNFVLVRHEYSGSPYFCLYYHLHWEELSQANSTLSGFPWILSGSGTLDNALLCSLKSGAVTKIDRPIAEGAKIWSLGEYGSGKYNAPLLHWEVFSQEILPGTWDTIIDSDDDFTCDNQYHSRLVPGFVDTDGDGNWDRDEIVAYFRDTPRCQHLRNYACKFVSEFAVDWDQAVADMRGRNRFSTVGLADRIRPYNFWAEAYSAGIALSSSKRVWHYNPIAFVQKYHQGPTDIIIIVGTDAPSDPDHSHKSEDSFVRRVDRLLNTPTVENLQIGTQDHVFVIVPNSMPAANVTRLQSYGRRSTHYEVLQKSTAELRDFVNSRTSIRYVAYFGHGINEGPLYEYGVERLPAPGEFQRSAFTPDAFACFATCNSRDYAQLFTSTVGVSSVGVEGTTFYGTDEISAGLLPGSTTPGTALAWRYRVTPTGVESDSYSLSQLRGAPFLKSR